MSQFKKFGVVASLQPALETAVKKRGSCALTASHRNGCQKVRDSCVLAASHRNGCQKIRDSCALTAMLMKRALLTFLEICQHY